MKRPRRRQRPGHSWDRLNGTRLEVLPLPLGDVRRVCVNATDPLPAVVSFGRHALTSAANERPTLRLLAVDNWNEDERELHAIPEARAWFRQLWHEGKPLLRLLSESSWDMPPDDRFGLGEYEITALGLGWFDIYMLGMCEIDGQLVETEDGPRINAAVWGSFDRDAIRAELLEMSPAKPEGYTFDDAANRHVFTSNNMPTAVRMSREMGREADSVVLVLSLLDPVASQVAEGVSGHEEAERQRRECKAKGLHPAVVVALPREFAAGVVGEFAPGAAGRMVRRPESGWHWGVFVAFNGTTLAEINPPATEGTT